MARSKKTNWIEKEFEEWFCSSSFLPSRERLVVVACHKPIRRVVDLIAVDEKGGLVIIEVKNEQSNRRAIGQALEYLSQYNEYSLDNLIDDYEEDEHGTFRQAFASTFNIEPPQLTKRRRVFVVAPSHDSYSAVCTRYLSELLSGNEVSFDLLTATKTSDGCFSLEEFKCPPLVLSSSLGKSFARSPTGVLFYVIDPGSPPILWRIGKLNQVDSTLAFTAKPTCRALIGLNSYLLPIDPPEQVDLSHSGSVWKHISKPAREGIVVGTVSLKDRKQHGNSYVVFAQFDRGGFSTFRKRPSDEFSNQWKRLEQGARDWRTIYRLAQKKDATKRIAKEVKHESLRSHS